jgi:hypothetical protein
VKACRFVSTKRLPARGTFTLTRPKVKKKTYFQAFLEDGWAFGDAQGNPICYGPSPTGQPIPCILEILSPVISGQVKVLPPKRHHR